MEIKLRPIGIINSQYKNKEDKPRQDRYSDETSLLTVFDEFKDGLE